MVAATGGANNIYAVASYDGTMLAALAILACRANNGTCVQHILPTIADSYFGASGWMKLDANGGVLPTSQTIWQVVTTTSGAGQWQIVGTISADGTISYKSP